MLTDCESGRARRESAAEDSLFNLEGAGDEVCGRAKIAWGYSSAGRAPALQAGGRRFDPDYLHHPTKAYAFAGTKKNNIIANRSKSEQSSAKRVCEEEETQRNERDVLHAVRRGIWSLCRRTGP